MTYCRTGAAACLFLGVGGQRGGKRKKDKMCSIRWNLLTTLLFPTACKCCVEGTQTVTRKWELTVRAGVLSKVLRANEFQKHTRWLGGWLPSVRAPCQINICFLSFCQPELHVCERIGSVGGWDGKTSKTSWSSWPQRKDLHLSAWWRRWWV